MRSFFAAVLAALALAGGASLAEAATGSTLRAAGAQEGKARPHLHLARAAFDDDDDVRPSRRSRMDGPNWKRPRYAKQRHARSTKRLGRRAAVRARAGGSGTTGMASYYGGRFHGRRTASGARFDSSGLTAAHRTLPFGTKVRVTHLGSGRSVVVRINDRGPFVGGRIIDLSKGAAGVIGMHKQGVARVKVTVLDR
ncbi:MAG: septal ring lytic transglycosylase RlpA family protein [Hyphomicrobiaceae bacterium]